MPGVSIAAAAPAAPAPRRGGLVVLLVSLAAVALALAAQSIVAYRRALDVEELLGRAQAQSIQRAIGPSLRRVHDAEGLAEILDAHHADGLRYLALLAPGPRVHAEAGASIEPRTVVPDAPPGPGRQPDVRIGARWRMYSALPPPGQDERMRRPRADRRERRPPEPGPAPPVDDFGLPIGPSEPPPRPPLGPPPFVIEVEPSAGGALRREAARSLVVGLASAVALLGVTALLVRWLRQRERLEARLAHDRRLAALGEMSAVLAHEIRNPLASLKGHAQLLVENLDGDARARDRAKAERVVAEAIRLERLTNDLLEFARTGRIERAPCDPADVLATAVAPLGSARLTLDTAAAPPRWSLDAGRMAQVLANLVGNALQADPDGQVTVRAALEDGRLVYRVRDHGPGLPPGDPARLFEPFHTTRGGGVGLGLAVAHRLVTLHGGTLAARTHPDGGAEVTVTIPEGA